MPDTNIDIMVALVELILAFGAWLDALHPLLQGLFWGTVLAPLLLLLRPMD